MYLINKICEKSIIEDDKKIKLYSLINKANEEYNVFLIGNEPKILIGWR